MNQLQSTVKPNFMYELEQESGESLTRCYQCGRCSATCPVSYTMDYLPHQVIRLLRLRLENIVLSSTSIWHCVSCQTCSTRCPQGVDFAAVMDALRIISRRKKSTPAETNLFLFNEIFIKFIRQFGRIYELGLFFIYNIARGKLLADLSLGPLMLGKGKINLLPPFKKSKRVTTIFKNLQKF